MFCTQQQEHPYYTYRPRLSSTLDRHQYSSRSAALSSSATTSRSSSMRRIRHQQELESRHIPNPSPTRTQDPRSRFLDINPAGRLNFKTLNKISFNCLSCKGKYKWLDKREFTSIRYS